MQGFWVKYAAKCKEAKRNDKTPTNNENLEKKGEEEEPKGDPPPPPPPPPTKPKRKRSGSSQTRNADVPNHKNCSETVGSTTPMLVPGYKVQSNLARLRPAQRSNFNPSEITHRGQVDRSLDEMI